MPVLAAACLLCAAAAWPARAYEQRRNTPSFGFQYGYGAMNGSGELRWENEFTTETRINRHRDFRWGGALGVRFRYSLDASHAVGGSFEDLRYGRKSGLGHLTANEMVAEQLQVNTFVFDYYLYFNRRARSTPYLVIGAGLHRDTYRFSKSDIQNTSFKPGANLGLGLEYFVGRAWSIDTTVRGAWFSQPNGQDWKFRGSAPVAASLQMGIQYYLVR